VWDRVAVLMAPWRAAGCGGGHDAAAPPDRHRRRCGGAGSAPGLQLEDHREAIADTRQEVVDRAAYLTNFLAWQDRSGDASDGDGFAWCNDCNDANAGVSPGAPEICGNGIDDNRNFLVDADEPCGSPAPAAATSAVGGAPSPTAAATLPELVLPPRWRRRLVARRLLLRTG
jgi:hypothetical protein